MKNLPKLGAAAGRKTGLAQTLSTLVLTVTVAFVASIILAWPVKWLWNWLVPGIFGGSVISVAQAWGLILLAQLLIPRSLAPTGQAKSDKA
jgi:predicted PurR-regulated permease PerM